MKTPSQKTRPKASEAPSRWGFLGSDWNAARFAQSLALEAGMTPGRSLVAANVASFPRDGWVFRKKLAKQVGVSVRTVQRALTQSAELGLLEIYRGHANETPHKAAGPVTCGFSHRLFPHRGKTGQALRTSICARRALRLMRKTLPVPLAVHAMTRSTAVDEKRWNAERERQLQALAASEGISVEELRQRAAECRARAGPSDHN